MKRLLYRIKNKLCPSKNLKYGFTNSTRLQGESVIKHFKANSSEDGYTNEVKALGVLSGKLPIPELISSDSEQKKIRTKLVAGIHAADITDSISINQVHQRCGELLANLHALPVDLFPQTPNSPDDVIVHGDFNTKNILVSKSDHAIVALLDWEQVHLGKPLEDICWYEWVLRRNDSSNDVSDQLKHFYIGYGTQPSWADRHQGILDRLNSIIDGLKDDNEPTDAIEYWMKLLKEAEAFQEI
ncbi:MAG TPA: hypothetical protein DCR32_05655 [Opitutae bacterium]|nr:hypothetical protein [Opitutae bacterium]